MTTTTTASADLSDLLLRRLWAELARKPGDRAVTARLAAEIRRRTDLGQLRFGDGIGDDGVLYQSPSADGDGSVMYADAARHEHKPAGRPEGGQFTGISESGTMHSPVTAPDPVAAAAKTFTALKTRAGDVDLTGAKIDEEMVTLKTLNKTQLRAVFGAIGRTIPSTVNTKEKLLYELTRIIKDLKESADFNRPRNFAIDGNGILQYADPALIPLPVRAQPDDYSCWDELALSIGKLRGVGPATLAAWKEILGSDRAHATFPERLATVLTGLGLEIEARQHMTVADLRGYCARGWPVICPVQEYGPETKQQPYGHAVAVVGFAGDNVLAADSSIDNVLAGANTLQTPGLMPIPIPVFEAAWWELHNGVRYERYGIAVGERRVGIGDDGLLHYADAAGHEHKPAGSPEGGQFTGIGANGGGAKTPTKQKAKQAKAAKKSAYKPAVKIRPAKARAFEGKPIETQTRLSKQEAGKLGEEIIIAHLQEQGLADARPMNMDVNNYPIDLIQDHETIEAKTGQVSNSPGAQQWRLTIGEPGKVEKALLAQMNPEEKTKHHQKKQAAIHARKELAIKQIEKDLGRTVKRKTMTVLLNPDTKTADIFVFDGYHDRIGWNSELMRSGYVRTVTYS